MSYLLLQDGSSHLLLQDGGGALLLQVTDGGATSVPVFAHHYDQQNATTMWLRQSTASQEILLGPFVDSTDGATAETGLTIANTDIKIWKEGGTTEASKNSGGATHIASGRYYTVLDATDTDTLGKLEISVAVSGALPVRRAFVVLPAMVYDSLVLGTDTLQADVTQISGSNVSTSSAQLGVNVVNAAGTAWGSGAITAASIASNAITAAKIADGAIDAATFAADVDAEILSYLVDDDTRIDASALNTAATAVGSNGSGLTEAGGTGDQFTAIPWNAAWDTEVESEVTDSLVAHNLDHLCKTATAAADMTTEVADNTILSRILSNGDTSVFDPSTDGLQPIRDRGDAAWVTATGFSTHTASDVWSVATRVLTAGTNIALAKGTGVTGFNDLDAAGVRSAVGLASANLDTQLGDLPTAAENANAVLTTAMTESYAAQGASPTLAQFCFLVHQSLFDSSRSGTTWTIKKLDQSTTAATATFDDATNPTGAARAT